MKIRNGFVSNSSTTSFCIYGASVDNGEQSNIDILKKIKNGLPEIYNEFLKGQENKEYYKDKLDFLRNIDKLTEEDEEELDCDTKYIVEDLLEKLNVYTYYPPCGTCYMGRSWSSIKDEETGKQFKEKVEEIFKNLFGDDVKLGTCEHAWVDN